MPPSLQEIIDLFQHLPEAERRESLIAYAEAAAALSPKSGECYDHEEVRRDSFCSDTVGIHLRMESTGQVHFAISLGPKIQTLTRALAAILCRSLDGCQPAEILAVPREIIPCIVGSELVRLRSQTIYYILDRIQEAVGKAILRKRSPLPGPQ